MPETTVVRKADEGRAIWMLGGLYEVLVSSDETGGATTVMKMTMPAGMGPPPHRHPGSETVYVLDGTVDYHIGDETVTGGPGTIFHIPADTLERFDPTTAASVLVTYAPGGIEKFFAEAGEAALTRELPPPSSEPPDFERIVEIAAKYGMNIQPPA